MLNIHPSLLPALRGLHTHERALAAGLSEHGCTVHFVEPELDAGPIVAQARVPVLPGDDADTLAARVLVEEHKLYPQALAQGRRRTGRRASGPRGPMTGSAPATALLRNRPRRASVTALLEGRARNAEADEGPFRRSPRGGGVGASRGKSGEKEIDGHENRD